MRIPLLQLSRQFFTDARCIYCPSTRPDRAETVDKYPAQSYLTEKPEHIWLCVLGEVEGYVLVERIENLRADTDAYLQLMLDHVADPICAIAGFAESLIVR